MSYPSLSLTSVDNTNIDSTQRTISGLSDNTKYFLRGVLRNTNTGQQLIINKLLDDTGAIVTFTTPMYEVITYSTTTPTKTFTTIEFELDNFNSTQTTTGYDIYFYLYKWNGSTYVKDNTKTQILTNISNASFATLLTPIAGGLTLTPIAFQDVMFTGLDPGAMYRCRVSFKNRQNQLFYQSGLEQAVFDNITTDAYAIEYTIDTTRTTRNARSITLYFTRLKDNTGSSGVFTSFNFYARSGVFTAYLSQRTNLSFVNTGDTALAVTFSGLATNTSYNFTGLATRNTIYSNLPVNFSPTYTVSTETIILSFMVNNVVVTQNSIQFVLTGLGDNTGATGSFSRIQFRVYAATDTTRSTPLHNTPYEYLNVPPGTTSTFTIGNLNQDTAYYIDALFDRSSGGYLAYRKDVLLSQRTLSETLNAQLIVDDAGIVVTSSTVTFTISDFQSEYTTDTHTIDIFAVREEQYAIMEEALVVYWSFETSRSLSDSLGNAFIANDASFVNFDNAYLLANQNGLQLNFIPADWRIFTNLGKDWKQTVDLYIPTSSTQDKLLMEFVNPENNKGFRVHWYNNNIQYQGYVRLADSNPSTLLFNHSFDITSYGLYDSRHTLTFDFETFPVNAIGVYGRARVFIDGVQATYFDTSNAGFSAATKTDGVYLRTTNASGISDTYKIELPISNSRLYNFKIGSLSLERY